ncbi:hypothetical protein VKT23_010910 [Stygiomarasmius scandens]|uniref:Uncharacterized protein n=1 Tax=Marasmiellus scandens TaxID=2682957 RepID=A0ABR1JAG5_9AGAR
MDSNNVHSPILLLKLMPKSGACFHFTAKRKSTCFEVLDGGKLDQYLERSKEKAEILSRVVPSAVVSSPKSHFTPQTSQEEDQGSSRSESNIEIPDPPDSSDELDLLPDPPSSSNTLSESDSNSSEASDQSKSSSSSTNAGLIDWDGIEYVDQWSGSDNATHIVGENGELILECDVEDDSEGERSGESEYEDENSDLEPFEQDDEY